MPRRAGRAAVAPLAASLLLWVPAGAAAQEPLPPGAEGAPLPPGHPPVVGGAPAAAPPAPAPAAGADGETSPAEQLARRIASGENVQVAQAVPTADVPGGTVRAQVTKVDGTPVAGAEVQLVELASMGGGREVRTATTDAEGRVLFEDLPRGTQQSYTVSTVYRGATAASPAFQLPPMVGYDVRLLQLDTTADTRTVVESIALAAVEIRDERLHVTQRTTLMNLGGATVVFPGDGVRYRLPEGFTAFQSEATGDLELVANDRGFDLRGSLSPGQTTFAWTFDVPIRGGDMELDLPSPFRTFRARVLAEAGPTMDLDVRGFPGPQEGDQQGRRFLVTESQWAPTEGDPERIELTISGIPGPGPWRLVAVVAALALVLGGFGLALIEGDDSVARRRARQKREAELLAEIAELERQAARDEIGPRFREREVARLVGELATLLRDDREADRAATPARARPKTARAAG